MYECLGCSKNCTLIRDAECRLKAQGITNPSNEQIDQQTETMLANFLDEHKSENCTGQYGQ